MGSTGVCSDNATAGTFFATLTKELINGCSSSGREEPRRRVLDCFEIFDNATRRHSTLGVLSPACCEGQNESLKQLNDIDNN
jgi:putative transposase